MLIAKTKIRTLAKYTRFLKKGDPFYVGLRIQSYHFEKLRRIGFTKNIDSGETILPFAAGSVSSFNAEGKEIKLTDLPMETAYSQVLWTWRDWGGYEHSQIVD